MSRGITRIFPALSTEKIIHKREHGELIHIKQVIVKTQVICAKTHHLALSFVHVPLRREF